MHGFRALAVLVFLRGLSLLGGEVVGFSFGDLRLAAAIDPLSFDIRQTQIEVLFKLRRLEEATWVARAARDASPGDSQAQAAYAAALVMYVTHEKTDPLTPMGAALEAERAIKMDPASAASVERLMFLLAAQGRDLDYFQRLGGRRATLLGSPTLKMKCRLCGRHWMAHRKGSKEKSDASSNSK